MTSLLLMDQPQTLFGDMVAQEVLTLQLLWGGHSAGGVLITFNTTLSVDDYNNALSASVFYPNPSRGKINIENGRENNTTAVYDMMGRIVKEINYREQSSNSIDLSDLNMGLYTALLLGNNNIKGMKRIVIR